MFDGPMMLFVILIMSIIHISLWQIFPQKLRHLMFANPVLAFVMDFMGSGLITVFTGVASFVGICNLGASVVFGVYALWYIKHHGITGVAIDSYKLFKWIPIFPRLMVVYEKDGRTWKE
jgi:hypothetical protein